jgi:DUF3014 family protein
MQRQSRNWFGPIILAVAAAVALWYFWPQIMPPESQPVEVAEPVVEEADEATGPAYPVRRETEFEMTDKRKLIPLPSLDQSDAYFKMAIADLLGDEIEGSLAESDIIDRVVATIDSLPRAHVAERIRPLGRVSGQFLVDGQDDSGEYTVNDNNYHRYDILVDLIIAADPVAVTDLYRRFYPLFQSAYVDLGYPDGYFNDRLVDIIDHLLETPEMSGPIELVRPNVLYEYRDAELEALSSGQKLMLRIGAENSAKIKANLRELRALITTM